MIFYYSATQKTQVYAEILGEILNRSLFKLDSALGSTIGFTFMARALWLAITKKAVAVLNIPAVCCFNDDEIYLCCPVWGGHPAAPIRYFFQNAPIKGKKVNMILTADVSHVKYIDNGKKMIADAGCIPGNVEVFATGGEAALEKDVIEAHIRHLMFDESISEALK